MVLKNYKPIDTENIMKQLHNGKVVSEKAVEPSLSQIPSVAHRRRQSMMDNTNYKFAYSRKKLILLLLINPGKLICMSRHLTGCAVGIRSCVNCYLITRHS